jgi:hypothetical protein
MQERARLDVKNGELAKATERLRRLATHLLSQGEQGLARTVLVEVEHIEQQNRFRKTGKRI